MRDDVLMSWSVHEVVALPRPINEAYELVRSPIRILIAHYLADHPESRVGEIIEAIGSERMTIRYHLSAMEKIGAVTVSVPAGNRQGQWVRYSLNRTRWTELTIRLISYLPAELLD